MICCIGGGGDATRGKECKRKKKSRRCDNQNYLISKVSKFKQKRKKVEEIQALLSHLILEFCTFIISFI